MLFIWGSWKGGLVTKWVFRKLVNRVTKKIKDWKSRTLPQANKLTLVRSIVQSILTSDKLTLVRSVVQSILTYLITCFKIPDNIIRKLKRKLLGF